MFRAVLYSLSVSSRRGEPMSWKITHSASSAKHCTGNLLLCQVPEKFLLFQLTNQTAARRVPGKGREERRACCWWLRGATTQKPTGEQREPGHGHYCSPACEEKKYRVSSRNQKPEMPCFWRTSDLAVLLIWGVFVAGESEFPLGEGLGVRDLLRVAFEPCSFCQAVQVNCCCRDGGGVL